MVGRITHDWYQTETQVVIEIRIKKLGADMVKVDIGDTSLSVTAKLPGSDSEYIIGKKCWPLIGQNLSRDLNTYL